MSSPASIARHPIHSMLMAILSRGGAKGWKITAFTQREQGPCPSSLGEKTHKEQAMAETI